MDKVIRDGKVAVLVSPGFGAGWSTWNSDIPNILFNPAVVALVEAGKRDEITKDVEGLAEAYLGGAESLIIEWLPIGTRFQIGEYDGSESLSTESDQEWSVA